MYSFDDFLGNEYVVKGLENMISSGRMSHAFIFDAPEGFGKLTLAKTFAKTLQCEKGGTAPCGECFSCKSADSDENPDIIFVSSDKATFGVDKTREEIIEKSLLKPYSSRYKIFIIKDAQKMTEQAQNTLLKTIEEPPSYGIYILLTTNYNTFIETILSRCALIRLNGLSEGVIERELVKKGLCGEDDGRVIAACSGGSLGRAIKLSQDEGFMELRMKAAHIPARIEDADLMGLYDIMNDMIATEDRLPELIELLYVFYRDVLVQACGGSIIQKDLEEEIKKISKKVSLKRLLRGANSVLEAGNMIKMNVNKQMSIENMLFKIKER